ncbi:MAG: N-acetylmuramoyl-L-alanine amidase [Ignavibacteria bacterium]|jgi:N-acetylmuramoyl-L-alanine amidase
MTYKFINILIIISFSLIFNSTVISADKLDVIVIDAGHGGKDPGTIGLKGTKEKDINLAIAIKLGELIQQRYPEMKVIYTRTKDEFIEVHERTLIANNNRAKLFISIHANHKKEEESEKNGFEIYMLNPDKLSEAVAITQKENSLIKFQQYNADTTDSYIYYSLVQNGFLKFCEYLSSSLEINLINTTELASRGVMQAGYWVLLAASMPSVLVETGYISDENDEKYLSSGVGQLNVAKALFGGFNTYKMLYETN